MFSEINRRSIVRAVLGSAVFAFAIAGRVFEDRQAQAADWPMWRHNAQRSGATSETLSDDLHLQWTRRQPPAMPAWPNEARLHFDASYEPIVMGSQMFVGSMLDGSLAAIDCRTGQENWRFYTNGPVRLAPVAFDDCVCFGSDDGWLYCLDAISGRVKWKVCGAPAGRTAYRHLGNARLVSFWPVRGGPVQKDGVIYFGAGIWPTLGVFVHAVDATTGRILWTNDNSHAIENVRVDHNYIQESGISPQGHMLVQDDKLIVPNGRSMPARLDRRTGKLHYFVQGYRNGDSRVVVSGDIALVGRSGVINLKDGREIASRWAAAGKDAPTGWSSAKVDLFEGPLFPYKFSQGCDHRSVIDGDVAYGVDDGVVYAYDLKKAKTSLANEQFNGKDIKPARWDAPQLWALKTAFAGKKLPTNATILAGGRLYGHSGKNLFAVKLPKQASERAKLVWSKPLPSTPTSLLAANGQLMVVSEDGSIRCFGSAESKRPLDHPIAVDPKATPVNAPSDAIARETADQILKLGGQEGYAIVAGLKDGKLVDALLKQSQLQVIAIDADQTKVDALRRRYAGDPNSLRRFQAIVSKPNSAKLPPYIANVFTSEDAEQLEIETQDDLCSIFNSLRPYGGTLCLPLDDEADQSLRVLFSPDQFAGGVSERHAQISIIRRDGPLPGSAIWSHETGDAARSFFSRDELVQAPLAVLWYGDGRDHGFHKRKDYGHGLKPQVAGGRLFALQVATNTLKAVDAYTGRLLWSRKLGASARYASMADGVYVADGRKCLVLDAANGKTRREFAVDVSRPIKDPVSVSDIRVGAKVILIATRFNHENAISKGRWDSELIVALDRKSGRQLWSRPAKLRYNTAAIAVASGSVYCIDSHSPEVIASMRRRGQDVEKLPSTILALDAQSGRERWSVVRRDAPAKLASLHFMGLRTQDDWLAYAQDQDLLVAGRGNATFALNARSGKLAWEKPMRGQQPLILGPQSFINQTGHTYDVASGKLLNGAALFRRGGCNYAVGGKNLLFLRSNCATYVDIESREEYAIRSLRSGCSNSLVAADGLLNAPCFSVGCVCNYPIQTSFAMFHMPQAEKWHGKQPVKQEVR